MFISKFQEMLFIGPQFISSMPALILYIIQYTIPFLYALSNLKVRGTIFNELDDDKLHALIDFVDFEERFKIGNGSYLQNGSSEVDGFSAFPSKRFKKPEHTSVLEHTRLRNIGK